MRWQARSWLRLAALSGLLSVAAGAFAAHGASDATARDWLRTGATYQAVHALATIACRAFTGPAGRLAGLAPAFFLGGAALFSGSLYAMALGGPHWLGAVTPVGGLLFMAGWAVLMWAAGKHQDPRPLDG